MIRDLPPWFFLNIRFFTKIVFVRKDLMVVFLWFFRLRESRSKVNRNSSFFDRQKYLFLQKSWITELTNVILKTPPPSQMAFSAQKITILKMLKKAWYNTVPRTLIFKSGLNAVHLQKITICYNKYFTLLIIMPHTHRTTHKNKDPLPRILWSILKFNEYWTLN